MIALVADLAVLTGLAVAVALRGMPPLVRMRAAEPALAHGSRTAE